MENTNQTTADLTTTKPKRRFNKKATLIGSAIFVAGIGVGCAAGGADAAPVEPKVVTKTVTETKNVEVPVEVPVDVEVPVTPEVCLTALQDAEKLVTITGEMGGVLQDVLTAVPDGMTAAATWDTAGVKKFTKVIEHVTYDAEDITARVQKNGFAKSRAACEATAKGGR